MPFSDSFIIIMNDHAIATFPSPGFHQLQVLFEPGYDLLETLFIDGLPCFPWIKVYFIHAFSK